MGFVRWREEETYDCDSEQTSAGGLPCIFLTENYDCRSLKLFCRVTMSRDRHLNEHASAEELSSRHEPTREGNYQHKRPQNSHQG